MATERIFPTENDVGSADTYGQVATEATLINWLKGLFPRQKHENSAGTKYFTSASFVITGLAPSDGGGLTLDVAAGKAIVDGYYVNITGTTNHTLVDDTTNYVYLQLTRDGSDKVTGAQFVNGAATRDTTDAIILSVVSTASGSIVTFSDERRWNNGIVCGRYTGDATLNRTIDLEQTPVLVIVSGVLSGDSEIIGVSAPRIPGYRHETADSYRGFYFIEETGTITSPKILTNTATWDPPNISNENYVSTTVTVTGAAVGDPVQVTHSDFHNATTVDYRYLSLHGVVTATNTVTVYIHNHHPSNTAAIASGTLRVMVWDWDDTITLSDGVGYYTEDENGTKIPFIVNGGFRVGHFTAEENLNDFGKEYSYVAFM